MAFLDKSKVGRLSRRANDFAATGAYRSAAKTETTVHLAQVRGNIVASIKARGLAAHKLLLLEAVPATDPLKRDDAATPQLYVAVDLAGAGVGEIVLVVMGSAARVERDGQSVPTDAAVVAIVDSVQVDGRTTFVKP
jgi:microcompartment protein CcmK/EutM